MDREKVARECVRIERQGGNVRKYLAGLGCVSPWGTWHRLQVEELGRKPHEITDGLAKRNNRNEDIEREIWTMGKTHITHENRLEAVRIALDGGSPLTYLEGLGITRASAAWVQIKKRLKEQDPETYAKLPKRLASRGGVFGKSPKPKSLDECETMPGIALGDVIRKAETPEKPAVTMPLMYINRTVTAVSDENFGEFHRIGEYVDWKTKDGNIVSMTITDWRLFIHTVGDNFRILGAELK